MEKTVLDRYEGTDLRIMTNNILFSASKKHQERGKLLIDIYRDYLPDILSLQEVDPAWYSMLFAELGVVYAIVEAAPRGEYSVVHNLNPIFYRKDRFEVLEKMCYTTIAKFDSEVTYAVLRDKQKGKIYIVYNVHLLVNSLSPTAEIQRRGSVARVTDTIAKLKKKYDTEYAFMMGDFNAVESTESYKMAASYLADSKYIAEIRSNTTRNTGHTIGEMPLLVEQGPRNYDYILVNPDVTRVMTHDIVTTQAALDGSDHCPVYVDVILK